MFRRWLPALFVIFAVSFLVVACGSEDGGTDAPAKTDGVQNADGGADGGSMRSASSAINLSSDEKPVYEIFKEETKDAGADEGTEDEVLRFVKPAPIGVKAETSLDSTFHATPLNTGISVKGQVVRTPMLKVSHPGLKPRHRKTGE